MGLRTMTHARSNAQPAQIPTAAPDQPYFKLFREYRDRAEILDVVRRAFFDGIERLVGRECRERCESVGLAQMHRHYPAKYVDLLEAYVNHRIKRRVLEWTAAIGRHDVGLAHDFLVEDLLIVRVHYPHSQLGQPVPAAPTPPLQDRIRFGLASSIERMKEAYDSKSSLRIPGHVLEYVRQRRKRAVLPLPYRCHAPHLDSWLGQPVTSLSVWLAVEGVDEHNGLCLYPETIGTTLPVGGSRFLGMGYQLPKPTRPPIHDGDLFVFSTDVLHSSQLNISDKTRIALTTRIDPGTPTFSEESLWFVERWYSADGIHAGRWRRQVVRSADRRAPRRAPAAPLQATPCVEIASVFRDAERYPVAPSASLADNDTLAVQFENKRILVLRANGELKAFSGRCPHGDYRMDDGYHDACVLVCPGHGLEFDARTGRTALARYRLLTFGVFEQDGTIFLGTRP